MIAPSGLQSWDCIAFLIVATVIWHYLYGPAVRCKPNVIKWRGLVLRICIRPLHGAIELLAIMDIRAYPISFSDRP